MKPPVRTAAELLQRGRGIDPDAGATAIWPYRVNSRGLLTLMTYLKRARAAGLTVEDDYRQGLCVRRGWIYLNGPWRTVSEHLRNWVETEGLRDP